MKYRIRITLTCIPSGRGNGDGFDTCEVIEDDVAPTAVEALMLVVRRARVSAGLLDGDVYCPHCTYDDDLDLQRICGEDRCVHK